MFKRIITVVYLTVLVTCSALLIPLNNNTKIHTVAFENSFIQNGGIYYIRNVSTGLCLDVNNNSSSNTATVIQWHYNGNKNQRWQVVYNADKTYSFRPLHAANAWLETRDWGMIIKNGHANSTNKFYVTETLNGIRISAKWTGTNNALYGMTAGGGAAKQVVETRYDPANISHHWILTPVDVSLGYVGQLSVFADDEGESSSWSTAGHSFITVDNFYANAIVVGKMYVAAGTSVSVGTFDKERKDMASGIWYNIEARYLHNPSASRVSLTMAITSDQLSTLNNAINSNDSWGLLDNCSSFAKDVWNSVSSVEIYAGFIINTPALLKSSIMESGKGYLTDQYIAYNGNSGYFDGDDFVKGD